MKAIFESLSARRVVVAQPEVSVVVIGRNEGQRLAKCLESIRQAEAVAIGEVIYVDSASTDGSAELASRYGANRLRSIRSARPRRLAATPVGDNRHSI